MRALAALAVSLLGLVGCQRSSYQECDTGCRNYYYLHYWRDAELEIAKVPEAQRAALRRQKQIDYEPRMTKELNLCIVQCEKTPATPEQVKCMIEAKTVEASEACLK